MPLVAVFSIYSQSTFISLPEQMSAVVVGRVEQQLVLVPPLSLLLLISTIAIVLMYARNTIKHSLCVSLFSRVAPSVDYCDGKLDK